MIRHRCCFLSMDSLAGYVSDDELAIGPLHDLGWEVQTHSWRDEAVDWDYFDIVVIRTTWDYQREPAAFLAVLLKIESSRARLENSLDVVKWNLDKRYLGKLAECGIQIVPTIWNAAYAESSFGGWLDEFGTDELIVKPTVSATAEHTYRLREFDPCLAEVFIERSFMVQPFIQNIVAEGEYSLFYFSGDFSHAILKSPGPADFRVQEEHGGIITSVGPSNKLLDAARKALHSIGTMPLYARVDLVRGPEDEYLLMELELIEPALYFRMDDKSPMRFAKALDRTFQ